MSRKATDELIEFMSDMYSLEQQALAQLSDGPAVAKESGFADDLRIHEDETKQQAAKLEDRLEEFGKSTSGLKDAVMKLGGKGFLAFAKLMPESPGRLLAHSYAFEALEIAGYDVMARMADEIADVRSRDLAMEIRAEEASMLARLEKHFDAVEEESHRDADSADMPELVVKHLTEAHALELEAIKLFEKGLSISDDPVVKGYLESRLSEAENIANVVENHLKAKEADTSGLKDLAMKLGGLNWALFFKSQKDAPGKYVAFVSAMLHLQIAGYELLARTAKRAGDSDTVGVCRGVLQSKREAAERLNTVYQNAVQETLAVVAG